MYHRVINSNLCICTSFVCRQFSSRHNVISKTQSFIEISGKDPKTFLQGLCTNDILKIQPNISFPTLFLNTKGRIVADCIIYNKTETPDSLIIEVHPKLQANLLNHLKLYKLRSKVTLTPIDLTLSIGSEATDSQISSAFIDTRAPGLPTRYLSPPQAYEGITYYFIGICIHVLYLSMLPQGILMR